MKNKIWIELDMAVDKEHALLQCTLANRMLQKLGIDNQEFWVGDGSRGWYNLSIDIANDSGYIECTDRGHWFNLDFLAK